MTQEKFQAILFKLGIFAVLLTAPSLSVRAEQAVPTDKAAHFGISATATTACSIAGKLLTGNKWVSEGVCFLAVNSVGVAKEITDPMRGGTRDKTDLYANLAGSGFSVFAVSFGF